MEKIYFTLSQIEENDDLKLERYNIFSLVFIQHEIYFKNFEREKDIHNCGFKNT